MTSEPPVLDLPTPLSTLRFLARPTDFMRRCQRELGDTFQFRLAGVAPTVMITHPRDVKAIFTAPHEDVPNVVNGSSLGLLLGPSSTLVLNGPKHIHHRRLQSPQFRGESLRRWAPVMEELTHERIDRWQPGQEVSLQEEMQAITFDTILAVIFGMEDAARQDAMRDVVVELTRRGTSGLRSIADAILAARGRLAGPLAKLDRELSALVYDEIANHRRRGDLESRTDVMSLLMLATDEEGRGLSDEELRDELVTLLIVGHETTATSLAWAGERLTRTPDAMAKLMDDAASAEPGPYIDATVYETLRDRPVVPIIGRLLQKPMTLGGYDLPAQTTVNVGLYLVNHRADSYEDPYRFNPDRFLGKRPDTYAWVPFGGGIRRCLGAAFAEMEMQHVMRVLYKRVRMSAISPESERAVLRAVTLAPQHAARVRVDAIDKRTDVAAESQASAA